MKKSTLIMILSLVLAVAIGIGSTMAYLQDTDEDVNVMTLGSVYITQNEQERNADGELVPFTPNKPAFPAVGPIDWADEGVVVNGTEYKVFTEELQNVVDKIVTVTNTGKSDAYIRTIIAIEAPDYDPTDLIHINYNDTGVAMSAPVCFTHDGVEYVCFSFDYADALAPQETSAPSLMQLFLDSKATNADVEKFGDTWEVLVLSQAVQTQGFADAKTALNTAFGEVTVANVTEWFGGDFGENTGTPGDKWLNNNPPSFVPEDAKTIANVGELKDALAAGGEYYMVEDIELENVTLTIEKDVATVLNMNGKTITGKATDKAASKLIEVKPGASLTIKGDGIVETTAAAPDTDWEAGTSKPFPGYATNTIVNRGELVIDGATIINHTARGGASYAIDNYDGATLTVNSGKVLQDNGDIAIRMFANSNTAENKVVINGGEITGRRAIWLQLAGSNSANATLATLEINGGVLTTTVPDEQPAVYSYSYGNSFANTNVTITGGTFNGDVQFGGGYKGDTENVTITGGTFNGYLGRWLADDGWEDIAKP